MSITRKAEEAKEAGESGAIFMMELLTNSKKRKASAHAPFGDIVERLAPPRSYQKKKKSKRRKEEKKKKQVSMEVSKSATQGVSRTGS